MIGQLPRIDFDHIWAWLGGIASLLAIIAVVRQVVRKVGKSPKARKVGRAIIGLWVALFGRPIAGPRERRAHELKAEIKRDNDASDRAIFARIDRLGARVTQMAKANAEEHNEVKTVVDAYGEKLESLTIEVANNAHETAEVKVRMESLESAVTKIQPTGALRPEPETGKS